MEGFSRQFWQFCLVMLVADTSSIHSSSMAVLDYASFALHPQTLERRSIIACAASTISTSLLYIRTSSQAKVLEFGRFISQQVEPRMYTSHMKFDIQIVVY